MAQPRIAPGFDLTDPDLYAERVPHEELAELRRAAPIWWNPQPIGHGLQRRRVLGGDQAPRTWSRSRVTATLSPATRTPRSSGS